MDIFDLGDSLSFELALTGSATSIGVNSFFILVRISLQIEFLLSNIVGIIELIKTFLEFILLNSTILLTVFSSESNPKGSVEEGITISLAKCRMLFIRNLHDGGQSIIT